MVFNPGLRFIKNVQNCHPGNNTPVNKVMHVMKRGAGPPDVVFLSKLLIPDVPRSVVKTVNS